MDATNLDIWHDDNGIWKQIDSQTYGPFETETEAENFQPGATTLTVKIWHLLADGDPALTDSIGELLRNFEAAGIVLDFEFKTNV